MSQDRDKYILVKETENHGYYGDCISLAPPDIANIPLIWELTHEEMYLWQNMFRQVYRYENWRFIEVVMQDQVTVDQMWADLSALQAREAEAARQRQEAEDKRKEAARKKRLAKETAKLAQDEELRKAMYNKLKQEFEAK